VAYVAAVPVFEGKHVVVAAPWSYPEDLVSVTVADGEEEAETHRQVDFSRGPPTYEGNPDFILQLKKDLGIKVGSSCPVTVEGSNELVHYL